jgi:para-aminobenzoate synthetase component 1
MFCPAVSSAPVASIRHNPAPDPVPSPLPGPWDSRSPLACLWDGDRGVGAIARPLAVFRVESTQGHPTSSWLVPARGDPLPPPIALSHDPLLDLDRFLTWGQAQSRGGWIGFFSYDLGRFLEPAAERGPPPRATPDRPWPLIELHRVQALTPVGLPPPPPPGSFRLGALRSTTGQLAYLAAVERVLRHIRDGDVYQANIAHRLSASFRGEPRALFAGLIRAAAPWHGAYMELAPEPGTGIRPFICSASPELFLEIQGERIRTRPMKGTRAGASDPDTLAGSDKERAELTMIVDLMRNDLGRLCRPGSIAVETPRVIERHGLVAALWQATATVSGRLEHGTPFSRILAAAFPPGSVTGAPKIRAMQIIDALEPVRRGPYCGSIGWIGDDGSVRLNVAIRTALVRGTAGPDGIAGELDYSIGAGIVADSDPQAEWEETLAKAGTLRALAWPQSSGRQPGPADLAAASR